jgi:hypothetical protein
MLLAGIVGIGLLVASVYWVFTRDTKMFRQMWEGITNPNNWRQNANA